MFWINKDLNCWIVFDFFNEMGKVFYNVGVVIEKDLFLKDVGLIFLNFYEEF